MFSRYRVAALASLACLCAPVRADEVRHFELKLENGRLADASGTSAPSTSAPMTGAPRTIAVNRGDTVEIRWSADRRTEVHLHGYDIMIAPDASQPQTMSFRARASGRFPIEVHGGPSGQHQTHRVLIYLEVHPR
jgi:FtsP/CotA-like multicopper oxidase with cupredoxin domain